MPHSNPTAQLQQIKRLLDNSAPAPKADPAERLRGFILATEGYAIHIMRRAVNNFISGTTDPKHDPNWPLQPAHLANECRRLHSAEVEHETRTRAAITQIREREQPFHQQPVDVRRAAVAAGLARLDGNTKSEPTPEQIAAKARTDAAYITRHDAAFVDTSPAATARRLGLPYIRQPDERQEREFTQDFD